MTLIKRTSTLVPTVNSKTVSPQVAGPASAPTPTTSTLPTALPHQTLMVTEHALADKKAEDISTLSLIGKTDVADAIVIATGTSSRHVAALANHVMDCLTRAGIPILGVEGLPSADWVVIDAGDMMVHLFQAEARQKYQLEKMWSVTFEPEETNTTTGTLTSAA